MRWGRSSSSILNAVRTELGSADGPRRRGLHPPRSARVVRRPARLWYAPLDRRQIGGSGQRSDEAFAGVESCARQRRSRTSPARSIRPGPRDQHPEGTTKSGECANRLTVNGLYRRGWRSRQRARICWNPGRYRKGDVHDHPACHPAAPFGDIGIGTDSRRSGQGVRSRKDDATVRPGRSSAGARERTDHVRGQPGARNSRPVRR